MLWNCKSGHHHGESLVSRFFFVVCPFVSRHFLALRLVSLFDFRVSFISSDPASPYESAQRFSFPLSFLLTSFVLTALPSASGTATYEPICLYQAYFHPHCGCHSTTGALCVRTPRLRGLRSIQHVRIWMRHHIER